MATSTERPLYEEELTEATDEREEVGVGGLPSEAQLVMLCLDYLRDLRRSYKQQDLVVAEGLDADYLSVAIYSLSRCFLRPPQLLITTDAGNDAWIDRQKVNTINPGTFPPPEPSVDRDSIELPDLTSINREIMYPHNPNSQEDIASAEENADQDLASWYDYDDFHPSNSHRFYPLNGLASGPGFDGPLSLGEIAAAGLAGLGARSRGDAEREMIQSPLFEQFVDAVRSKGFFRDPDTEGTKEDPEEERLRQMKAQEIYEDRYRKVVAKFRTKLATKAQQKLGPSGVPLSGNLLAMSAADRQRSRRQKRIDLARNKARHFSDTVPNDTAGSTRSTMGDDAASMSTPNYNVLDLEEAERLKSEGNAHMQKKEYQEAAEAYTLALKLSPAGPQSHVYFSNRAASLLSMKKFQEAILDSERSLALKPDYGKAHARLGLAHFLLGDYRLAMESYTVSLKYEPDNKSSKNYLEKAARRLAQNEIEHSGSGIGSSFSVVSEWDKSVAAKSLTAKPNKVSSSSSLGANKISDDRKTLINQKEADKFKTKGNSYMASRDYQSALEAYSVAIDLCPDGPSSHVYFSNRAAALCYLERYEEAEEDSLCSLDLEPKYGKAHARLGLSRFFLGDYQGAVEAYTAALEYDPNSSASKSYLAKAKARLDRENVVARSSVPPKSPGRPPTSAFYQDSAGSSDLLDDSELTIEAQRILQDPELKRLAEQAVDNPTMMKNLMDAMKREEENF